MSTNPENYTDLIQEYTLLQAKIAPEVTRIEEIKKSLKSLDYGTYDIAGCKVTIGHNARFNPARFEAAYPAIKHPLFYKAAPDMVAIKEHIARADLKAFQDEGDPRVTIK